jgi:glycosyltransferase involved in cell wall biosynthesis
MKGFAWASIAKIYLDKMYYKLFIKNVSQVIVQTKSMHDKLIESGFKKSISILAFDDLENIEFEKNEKFKKEKNSFIYVASLFPYKNHKRLLYAWNKLNYEGIRPKLYLTLDDDSPVKKWIKDFVLLNNLNVIFLENISREELLTFYSKIEVLIYPSLFEAYGLPLVEAKKYKMKIIASDLDYCWDFIVPDDFFNPLDVNSISRSIKRFLKKKKKLDIIYNSKDFFNKILKI